MSQKIFFNHIPKTAGTTVISILDRFYSLDKIMPTPPGGGWEAVQKSEKESLEKYDLIHQHKNVKPFLSNEWKIITFLRDPLKRLESQYNHWKTWTDKEIDSAPTPNHVRNIKKQARNLSLAELIKLDHPLIKMNFINGITKYLVKTADIDYEEIENMSDQELLKKAKKALDEMFLIGVVEEFENSMFLLQYKMNWPYEENIQSLNQREYLKQNYSDKDKKIIDNAINLDKEIYEYGKQLFKKDFEITLAKAINSYTSNNKTLKERFSQLIRKKEARKLAFVHIPKCAGTTTNAILDSFYNKKDIWPTKLMLKIREIGNILPEHIKENSHHLNFELKKENLIRKELKNKNIKSIDQLPFEKILKNFKLYHEHTNLRQALPNNWNTITFLRDPLKRMISHHNDWKNIPIEDIINSPADKEIRSVKYNVKRQSLPETLKINNKIIKIHFLDYMTRLLIGDVKQKKSYYIMLKEEKITEAKNALDEMIFVGIVERYFESIALLHYKMKWRFDPKFDSLNVRKYEIKNSKWTNEEEKLIKKFVELDKITYRYGKRLFQKELNKMYKEITNENFKIKLKNDK